MANLSGSQVVVLAVLALLSLQAAWGLHLEHRTLHYNTYLQEEAEVHVPDESDDDLGDAWEVDDEGDAWDLDDADAWDSRAGSEENYDRPLQQQSAWGTKYQRKKRGQRPQNQQQQPSAWGAKYQHRLQGSSTGPDSANQPGSGITGDLQNIQNFVSNPGNGKVACFKRSYGRGVGRIQLGCPGGQDEDAGLCYDRCPGGTRGVGPVCWQNDFPWTPSGRGVGRVMTPQCGNGEEQAGLCYDRCAPGTYGAGPVCWARCGGPYPEDCGAMCAASGKCAYVTGRMGKQALNVLKTVIAAGGCVAGPECIPSLAKNGIETGVDMEKFFAEEMDGICRN